MEPTEEDIVTEKIMNLSPERTSKVLAFIGTLGSMGGGAVTVLMKGGD